MPEISFQYPVWFLLFCALLGFGYAALLYFRDDSFKESAPNLSKLLAFLRFSVVTTIAALLLAPLLKSYLTETKKPIIVIAQDESQSIASSFSEEGLNSYKQKMATMETGLAEKFEVHTIGFGDSVRDSIGYTFEDRVTNLSELMQNVYDQYSGQNLGAVVLASDGIFNEGSNPIYSSAPLAVPIFTVALGDTTPQRDLLVKRVFHNKIAYLGDKFVLQVDIAATNCASGQSVLTVEKVEEGQNKIIEQTPVVIKGNDFFMTKEITLEAKQAGVERYLISLAKVSGERTTANNNREVFIDVLDARQKILLLANSPHPDISALKQTIESNKNYQLEVAYVQNLKVAPEKFDFVILHNLPSKTNDISGIMSTLNSRQIPRLFIAGPKTNLASLSNLQGLIAIKSAGEQMDEVTGRVLSSFSAFTLDPKIDEQLPKYAPAISPFGTFTATPQAQTILAKRVGKVDTDEPLLAIGESNNIKTGVLMCDGIWKWRLFNHLQGQNAELFDELFGKTIQYLSLKEDKRKFRVETDKNVFNENENVVFNAELYNDNYELVNDSDVSIVIKNSDGRDFPYTFNKLGNAYSLDAGLFPKGNYSYRATTSQNNKSLTFDGKFSIRPIELELFESTANHGLLRSLSAQTGGLMLGLDSLSTIAPNLLSLGSIKPVIYQTSQTKPIINLKWIFGILAFFLALEWFLRRYFGSY